MNINVFEKSHIDKITRMVGSGHYFHDLAVLQAAIDKKGAVSQDYFCKDENFCPETWGDQWRSKEELRKIREVLVNQFVEKIKSQNFLKYKDKMEADHYARYFHALAILKVDKSVVHHTKNDYLRNAFIELWHLDDGSEESWKRIDSAAWFISEAVKGLKHLPIRETIYPEE